jgi:hypothetical protein
VSAKPERDHTHYHSPDELKEQCLKPVDRHREGRTFPVIE